MALAFCFFLFAPCFETDSACLAFRSSAFSFAINFVAVPLDGWRDAAVARTPPGLDAATLELIVAPAQEFFVFAFATGSERPVNPVDVRPWPALDMAVAAYPDTLDVDAVDCLPVEVANAALPEAALEAHPPLLLLAAGVFLVDSMDDEDDDDDEYLKLSKYLKARLVRDSFGMVETRLGMYSQNVGSLIPSSKRDNAFVTYDSGSRSFDANSLVNFLSCLYLAGPNASFIPST